MPQSNLTSPHGTSSQVLRCAEWRTTQPDTTASQPSMPNSPASGKCWRTVASDRRSDSAAASYLPMTYCGQMWEDGWLWFETPHTHNAHRPATGRCLNLAPQILRKQPEVAQNNKRSGAGRIEAEKHAARLPISAASDAHSGQPPGAVHTCRGPCSHVPQLQPSRSRGFVVICAALDCLPTCSVPHW